MRKAFLILSVSSRLDDLRGLVQSIRSLRRFDDYTLNLMFQDPEGVADQLDRALSIPFWFIPSCWAAMRPVSGC